MDRGCMSIDRVLRIVYSPRYSRDARTRGCMSIDWVLRHSRDCPGSPVLPGCLDRGVYEYRPGPKTFPGLSTVPGTPGMLGQGSV